MSWTDQAFEWSIEFDRVDLAGVDRLAETILDATRDSRWFQDGPRPPIAIGLVGTLGAGKTRWTQGLAKALGVDESDVTSPTFTLVQSYATQLGSLDHADAYRIVDEDEWYEAGLEETLHEPRQGPTPHFVVVEWADRFDEAMPPDAIWIEFRLSHQADSTNADRQISIHGQTVTLPIKQRLRSVHGSSSDGAQSC